MKVASKAAERDAPPSREVWEPNSMEMSSASRKDSRLPSVNDEERSESIEYDLHQNRGGRQQVLPAG